LNYDRLTVMNERDTINVTMRMDSKYYLLDVPWLVRLCPS